MRIQATLHIGFTLNDGQGLALRQGTADVLAARAGGSDVSEAELEVCRTLEGALAAILGSSEAADTMGRLLAAVGAECLVDLYCTPAEVEVLR